MKGSLSWLLMELDGEGLGQFCCFYAHRAGSPGIPTTRSALGCCTAWKQRLCCWESELVLPHLWPQSQLYHLLQVIMGEAGRGSFPHPWHHMADKRAQGQLERPKPINKRKQSITNKNKEEPCRGSCCVSRWDTHCTLNSINFHALVQNKECFLGNALSINPCSREARSHVQTEGKVKTLCRFDLSRVPIPTGSSALTLSCLNDCIHISSPQADNACGPF